jgi:hypothetical protein
MADSPTTGDVKVTLKLDTDEAKKKVDEVERRLRNNERSRRMVVDRVNKDGFNAKPSGGRTGQNIADKLLEKVLPKSGGYNPQVNIGTIGKFFGTQLHQQSSGMPQSSSGTSPQNAGLAALKSIGNKLNPFPNGGINGDNAGANASTLGLAAALYKALDKGAQYSGLALAYSMKSGAAASQTEFGKFLSDANGTFSYANNYFKSWKESFSMAYDWDSTVAAVTGKLPDTFFYRSKFSRLSQFQKEFSDLMSRNEAQTRAGAVGNSGITDQLRDGFFLSMSR